MLTLIFRGVLLVAALVITWFIITRIRKAKMRIEDSLFWLFMALLLLVFSIFPSAADALASLFGVYSTANFLFAFFVGLLVLKVFMMSTHISRLEARIAELTQKVALLDYDRRTSERHGLTANDADGAGPKAR